MKKTIITIDDLNELNPVVTVDVMSDKKLMDEIEYKFYTTVEKVFPLTLGLLYHPFINNGVPGIYCIVMLNVDDIKTLEN